MKYRNVTIAGLPGAGSSTLGMNLAAAMGWEYFSGGDFMRQYAIKHGLFDKKNQMHHPATVYSDDYDRQIDTGRGGRWSRRAILVVDPWLPGFLAKQQVVFGQMGESLTIEHQCIDRQAYMPGLVLACRRVMGLHGLHLGLDDLLAKDSPSS